MFTFLREDSKVSTTRVVMFLIALCVLILSLAVCFNICYATIACKEIAWIEISAFIGSLTTMIVAIVFGKVKQKAIESDLSKANLTTSSNSSTSVTSE